ncbi:MAG: hypothetical protein K2Y14_12885 [Burkholderiales bacterium]|nr:hypothetical protein [Burkholderiales bacterium]
MKPTIEGFSQSQLISHNLDLTDAQLLRWFADSAPTLQSIIHDNAQFFLVSYEDIQAKLPILAIQTKTIGRRFTKLADEGILDKTILRFGTRGTKVFYRLGEKYSAIAFGKSDASNETWSSNQRILKASDQDVQGIPEAHDEVVQQNNAAKSDEIQENSLQNSSCVLKSPSSFSKDSSIPIVKKDTPYSPPRKEADAGGGFDFSQFSPVEVAAIEDWLAYKTERRQTYKAVGLKMLLKLCLRLSAADILVKQIEQSIAANYQGIVEPKHLPAATHAKVDNDNPFANPTMDMFHIPEGVNLAGFSTSKNQSTGVVKSSGERSNGVANDLFRVSAPSKSVMSAYYV